MAAVLARQAARYFDFINNAVISTPTGNQSINIQIAAMAAISANAVGRQSATQALDIAQCPS